MINKGEEMGSQGETALVYQFTDKRAVVVAAKSRTE